jgi:hypothetical protein
LLTNDEIAACLGNVPGGDWKLAGEGQNTAHSLQAGKIYMVKSCYWSQGAYNSNHTGSRAIVPDRDMSVRLTHISNFFGAAFDTEHAVFTTESFVIGRTESPATPFGLVFVPDTTCVSSLPDAGLWLYVLD